MNVDKLRNLTGQCVCEDVKLKNSPHNRPFIESELTSFACVRAPASVALRVVKRKRTFRDFSIAVHTRLR